MDILSPIYRGPVLLLRQSGIEQQSEDTKCEEARSLCSAERRESCLKYISRSEGRGKDTVANRAPYIQSKEDDDEGHELYNNGRCMYRKFKHVTSELPNTTPTQSYLISRI